MKRKWTLLPMTEENDEEFIGWELIDDVNDDYNNVISLIPLGTDIEESKENAALIKNAPKLLVTLKKVFNELSEDFHLYSEIEDIILKASGRDEDDEALNYFDDYFVKPTESVIHFDLAENRLKYTANATMSRFLYFEPIFNNIGIIKINISGDYLFTEKMEEYSVAYPIPELMSRKTYEDFLEVLSKRYENLASFMKNFKDNDDDISIGEILYDLFNEEVMPNYEREMTLEEYIETYQLIADSDRMYIHHSLPDFLKNSVHTIHTSFMVTYGDRSAKGVIFYMEKENRFFIYDKDEKTASFFMIPNTPEAKRSTKLKFIDLINNGR